MKFLKEKKGIIISFLIGIIIASSITVYATSYFASQVSYTTDKNTEIKTVSDALNDLYSKRSFNKINETLYWFYYYPNVGRQLILKEEGTVEQAGGGINGNKIRLESTWGSGISIYAVQTGNFRITMVTGDAGLTATPTTEVKNVNAGELICSGTNLTYGMVEALF